MSGARITSGLHWVSWCRGLGVGAGRKPRRRIIVCSCRWVLSLDWTVAGFKLGVYDMVREWGRMWRVEAEEGPEGGDGGYMACPLTVH